MSQTSRKYPNRGLGSKLREHFGRHPGQTLYITDLAQQFKVPEPAIKSAMYDILGSGERSTGYAVDIPARAWRWTPNGETPPRAETKTNRRMFEEIGQAKDGIVIQDEGGKLYLAKEL